MMNSEGSKELVSFITPSGLCEAAEEAKEELLPSSKKLYVKAYEKFNVWRTKHKTSSASESMLLSYFKEMADHYAPTSMWTMYSMLKTMINLKEKIDIGKYAELTSMLKRKSEGHVCKKASVLTHDQINQFLTNASDEEYLDLKVALIIGVCGACRKQEITDLKFSDIKTEGDHLVIRIQNKKSKHPKFFTIGREFSRFVKKYMNLRPKNARKDRFFMAYRNGKCINQVIGINALAQIPQRVAAFLKLDNPASYTGHSFRRSSATLVADAVTIITTLKFPGDWKSATVADGDVEESVEKKARIGGIVESADDLPCASVIKNEDINPRQLDILQEVDPLGLPSTSHNDEIVKREELNTVIDDGPSSSTAVSSSPNAPILKFETKHS